MGLREVAALFERFGLKVLGTGVLPGGMKYLILEGWTVTVMTHRGNVIITWNESGDMRQLPDILGDAEDRLELMNGTHPLSGLFPPPPAPPGNVEPVEKALPPSVEEPDDLDHYRCRVIRTHALVRDDEGIFCPVCSARAKTRYEAELKPAFRPETD